MTSNSRPATYGEARALVIDAGKPSPSFVQRTLRISYNRAAGYIGLMEAEGIVSAADSVGRRSILRDRH